MKANDMKRATPGLALALCVAVALVGFGCGRRESASRVANIFGPDNREDVTSSAMPWSTIGRVDSGCTGTLVGRRLVLTASHCVYDKSASDIRSDLLEFQPNRIDGANNRSTYIEHVWYGTKDAEEDRGRDWAILLLREPVGETYGWLPVRAVDVAAQLPYTVSVAGYSDDRNHGKTASVHRNCYVHKVVEPRLLHDCDAASGISGAAILANYAATGKPDVIGIAVSEFRQGAGASLHVNAYSDDYANAGIAATAFAPAVKALRDSIDSGLPYSDIDGVFHAANPNPPGAGSDGDGRDR